MVCVCRSLIRIIWFVEVACGLWGWIVGVRHGALDPIPYNDLCLPLQAELDAACYLTTIMVIATASSGGEGSRTGLSSPPRRNSPTNQPWHLNRTLDGEPTEASSATAVSSATCAPASAASSSGTSSPMRWTRMSVCSEYEHEGHYFVEAAQSRTAVSASASRAVGPTVHSRTFDSCYALPDRRSPTSSMQSLGTYVVPDNAKNNAANNLGTAVQTGQHSQHRHALISACP